MVVNRHSDKLVSPQHMALIVEAVLRPELKDDKVIVDGKSLEDAFNDYISLEENKSLLRNNLLPGSGTFNNHQSSQKNEETFDISKTKGMSTEEINEYMDKFS